MLKTTEIEILKIITNFVQESSSVEFNQNFIDDMKKVLRSRLREDEDNEDILGLIDSLVERRSINPVRAAESEQ